LLSLRVKAGCVDGGRRDHRRHFFTQSREGRRQLPQQSLDPLRTLASGKRRFSGCGQAMHRRGADHARTSGEFVQPTQQVGSSGGIMSFYTQGQSELAKVA
jgi:hypothetical protein